MKAISLEAPRHFKRIDVPDPTHPGPGEALVRVDRVGICGTDISGYLGKMPFFSYPRIPGHELGVEVLEVGEGVANVRPGDHCSVEPYINCQSCYACRRGRTNCCERHQTLGVHCDGGRLVFVGITTDEVRFRHPVFHRPEGTLLCSRNALSRDFTRIIGLIEAGAIDTGPWITHRTAFDELIDVFGSFTRPETGVIKAVVEVGE